jgi:CRP-like cAMP-binding protein
VSQYDFTAYRQVLAESVVFAHLGPRELDTILAACRLLDVNASDIVLSEGKASDGLYVILEGELEFFLPEQTPGGQRRPSRVRLNVLGPGRCFGEYGLIDDRAASASAQALIPTRLCFLPAPEFRRIMAQSDRIGSIINGNLLRFLVSRLRGKDQELDLILLAD